MAQRDFAKPGELYSADYLRISDLDACASFQTMFGLMRMIEKSASDADVISADKVWPSLHPIDVSPVYRVFSRNKYRQWKSKEFTASQTATVFIPPAPNGRQIIVEYVSIRTVSNTGEAYFHNDDSSITMGKIYITYRSDFGAANVYVPCGEGKGLYLTSTQGSAKLYASVNYYYEQLRVV